ncbi:MAG: hypothetical protein ACREMF_06665 [Gemmatimonadales bacterium]
MPGLADMHVHTSERDLPLFLANGVTLVREMNGSPTHVALRARIERGELLGPRLVVTSPLLTGIRHRLIKDVDDAEEAPSVGSIIAGAPPVAALNSVPSVKTTKRPAIIPPGDAAMALEYPGEMAPVGEPGIEGSRQPPRPRGSSLPCSPL